MIRPLTSGLDAPQGERESEQMDNLPWADPEPGMAGRIGRVNLGTWAAGERPRPPGRRPCSET